MFEYLQYGLENIELESVKKSIDKVLQYMNSTKYDFELDFSVAPMCLDYEATNYLESLRSKIDKKIQSQMLNPIELGLGMVDMYSTTGNSSSRMDRIEEHVDKVETKVNDVRDEVNERLDKDMPIVRFVAEKLKEAELEKRIDNDESD